MIYMEERTSNLKNALKIILVLLICLVGTLIRLKAYLLNNSFFLDESALALNIIHKNYFELFFRLDYGQVPPPLFAIFSKIMTDLFGIKEYVLRFIPLLSSILAIFMFYFVLQKTYTKFFSKITALSLFALNYPLAFHAQDFKQYSSDVLCFLTAYAVFISVDYKNMTYKKSVLLGCFLGGLIWCSHPIIFFTAGAAIVLAIQNKFSKKVLLTFAIPVLSLLFLYLVNLGSWHGNERLLEYWQEAFSGFSFNLFSQNILNSFVFLNEGLNLFILKAYLLLLLVTGSALLFREDKIKLFLLVTPIFFNMLAAQLHFFPFKGRLILYIIPIFIILMIKPLDLLTQKTKLVGILALLIIFTTFKDNFLQYPRLILKNDVRFYRHETKPLFNSLVENIQEEDVIYLYHLMDKSFQYYDLQYDFPKNTVVRGIEEFPKSLDELDTLPHDKKIWFLFINDDYSKSELPYFRGWLDKNCDIKEYYFSKGAYMISAQRKKI